MFDYFVQAGIEERWGQFASDAALWATYFPESLATHPDASSGAVAPVTQWHQVLFPGGNAAHVDFRQQLVKDWQGLPAIIIQSVDDALEQQLLGGSIGWDESEGAGDADQVLTTIAEETVIIHTVMPSTELVRAVHRVLFFMMLEMGKWLEAQGYRALSYRGGGDIGAIREVYPAELGFYGKVQRWRTLTNHELSIPSGQTRKPARTYADDTTIGGITGGVPGGGPSS